MSNGLYLAKETFKIGICFIWHFCKFRPVGDPNQWATYSCQQHNSWSLVLHALMCPSNPNSCFGSRRHSCKHHECDQFKSVVWFHKTLKESLMKHIRQDPTLLDSLATTTPSQSTDSRPEAPTLNSQKLCMCSMGLDIIAMPLRQH